MANKTKEMCIHDECLSFANEIWLKYGVMLHDISIQWCDSSSVSEIKKEAVSLETRMTYQKN
jgi:hypothetical protein